MQKIKMIRPKVPSSATRYGRTDAHTDGRGESDNPPKFSIKNCRGAKSKIVPYEPYCMQKSKNLD